jgi:sortase A
VKDHRYVDELSIEELEAALRLRRRQERLKRVGNKPEAYDPLVREAGTPPVRNPRDMATGIAGAPGSTTPVLGTSVQPGQGQRYSAVMPGRRKKRRRQPIKWRWVRDQVLLIVEIVAVLGLVYVIAQMTSTVREINEDSRGIQLLPTITPQPFIGAFVLPGGHTPPDADQQSRPVPVPAHLRDLIAAVTPMPVPTPGPEHAQRIIIPAIGVDAPVVLAPLPPNDWEHLKKGAAHYIATANPGERGNAVIAAHNDIYGEIFRYLPDLKVGDEVEIQTQSKSFTYIVQQTRIVEPTEVSVMDPTSTPVLTLISCYPYRIDTHRIVVIASLRE